MSRPGPPPDAQHSMPSFGTTREREFFKYLPPSHRDLPHVGRDTLSSDIKATSSSDLPLTAFAQLGALRLNAQRAMISLFGRHEQFILSEATRTLSLQDDDNFINQDELWLGACTMAYSRSFCMTVADAPASVKPPADRVRVVADLTQDEAYRNHPDVTGYPNIRFLACASIISPKGIVIGAYSIFDDKPRGPLSPDQTKFLADMAVTVMDYLCANRSRNQHLRGERMIVGLGSFLEGKGSLRTSWMDQTEEPTTPDQNDDVEGRVNVQQQEKQRSDDTAAALKNGRSQLPLRLKRPPTLNGQKSFASRDQLRLSSSRSSLRRDASDQPKINRGNGATDAFEKDNGRPISKKEIYSKQINETLSRAANLARESLEVEGVVFFDANYVSHESLVSHEKTDNESSVDGSASEGEIIPPKGCKQSELSRILAENSGEATLNPCRILGFATSHASSVNQETSGDPKIALSESLLGGFLRRHPGGQIFNFGEDGSISSDEPSDNIFKDFTTRGSKKFKRTRKSVLRQDAMALLALAPGSRSIIFWPVWDSHKSRWYAGKFAWTRTPQRVFTFDDEMTFCSTLGNSVMAEIHWLGALLEERAKSDLLAGISHELRSPLHGIFGTVELLNDTAMDALQRGLVHTIASCANTLLGSIDQLLKFAGINDLHLSYNNSSSSNHSSVNLDSDLDIAGIGSDIRVRLDVTVEEIAETVFAGFSFYNTRLPLRSVSGISFDQPRFESSRRGPKLILDIDSTSDWAFATDSDAWRVILTNLVGNTLKYTQEGYILISLKVAPVLPKQNSTRSQSAVTLTVKDTGCGMHPEFLQNGYFNAFSQENDLSPGNGLGASIARRSIASLNGDIQMRSQKNIGTEAVVSLTLDHAEPGLGDNMGRNPLASTIELVRHKTIGILGLGSSETDTVLASSLQNVCGRWLQMDAHLIAPSDMQFRHCEFYIAPYEYLDIDYLEIQPIAPALGAKFTSPVIVICPTPKVVHSLFMASQQRRDSDVLEFIAQPCGPHKLAKVLEICIQRQQQRFAASDHVKQGSVASTTSALDELGKQPPQSNAGLNQKPMIKATNKSAPALRQEGSELTREPDLSPKDSSYYDGSHFQVSSPAVVPPEKSNPAQEQVGHQSLPQEVTPTVLLVDDNDINMKLLVAFMKKLGYNYIVAQNGQEALDSFKENASRISIILMGIDAFTDISMPVMDGLESTRQIRAFEKSVGSCERATIVALTGVAQADVQRDAIGSGMDLFLAKPVQLNTIKNILKNGIQPGKRA
ncbi:hybrid sensor histidine kinase/response regulator [Aspergillus mulundensis]|uniref:Uncharacterized protein n=1 Tax=Aspergillus mulundensis TaxID=1810919 RepID=A0A3D8RY92_9EURO|nr:hypothetical protein DSM5745_05838 [Aspergillus mulundensis]RDW78986.1 hypothetical protein DSM5745_05838 [Aspergillus mulundensis]